ncbi:MAG TPA: hypothetical protein V6C86_24210 [Oculatellaceae cyanobacterium]
MAVNPAEVITTASEFFQLYQEAKQSGAIADFEHVLGDAATALEKGFEALLPHTKKAST